jgi:hypothetical protein
MSSLICKILKDALASNELEANLEDLSFEELLDLCKELDAVSHEEMFRVYEEIQRAMRPLRERASSALAPLLNKLAS